MSANGIYGLSGSGLDIESLVKKEYPPEEMVKGMIKAKDWLGAFLDKKV